MRRYLRAECAPQLIVFVFVVDLTEWKEGASNATTGKALNYFSNDE